MGTAGTLLNCGSGHGLEPAAYNSPLNVMNARILMIGISAAVLAGCGKPDTSIVGTWSGPAGVTTMTLNANPDSSFTLSALATIKGRWELDGNDLRLFRDISNGGDVSFGSDSDGAYHFTLSADKKTLTGMPYNNVQTVLTKH